MARALRKDIIARPMGMQSKVPKKKKVKGDSHWRNMLAGQYKNWEQSLMTVSMKLSQKHYSKILGDIG